MIHKRRGRGELQTDQKGGSDGSSRRAERAMALVICHRGYVLETGKIILKGKAAELSGNDLVRQAYLGR